MKRHYISFFWLLQFLSSVNHRFCYFISTDIYFDNTILLHDNIEKWNDLFINDNFDIGDFRWLMGLISHDLFLNMDRWIDNLVHHHQLLLNHRMFVQHLFLLIKRFAFSFSRFQWISYDHSWIMVQPMVVSHQMQIYHRR